MSIRKFANTLPKICSSAYIDAQACIIGEVEIGKNSSIWPMTVVRGDVNFIKIGHDTNIQDGSILHVTHKGEYDSGSPLIIGNGVTVGHGAILHGCTIGNYCLIGMGAVIMDNCVIADYAMIGAGAMLPPNKRVKSGELWLGNPAKKVRDLTAKQIQQLEYSAKHYIKLKDKYKRENQ
ncbi:Carbonic anhydrase, gamma class [hydrothermal vent metagenome]|uniref:Carbonic anhydrase, gamma class n=1 Tax=hydrothermal vent metagenome TaxID=652676 RepID=A0A3B0VW75_9ZZZZ